MKLDTAILGNDPCEDDGIPSTFIEDLKDLDELLPLSPKGPIYFDPIISLPVPGMVPQTATAFHSEGSGTASGSPAATEEQIDPTFHIEEEEEEEEKEDVKQAKPKRKGRGSRAAASGADPKERIRAKNRRAQARYREKLKAQREETSEVLEQTTADLERLRLENNRLLSRNEMMENVLVVRDHSVGILEKSREAEDKTKQPGGMLLFTSDTQLNIRSQRLLPLGKTVRPGFEENLSSSAGGTTCTAPRNNNPLKQHQSTTTTTSAPTNNSDETIENDEDQKVADQGRSCPFAGKTVAEMIAVNAFTHEEVQKRYRFYAEQLRDSLKIIEDPHASRQTRQVAEESMMEVLFETGCICFESAIINPTIFQKLLVLSVVDDDNSSNNIVKAAKWAEITRTLHLSDTQRLTMQPLRELFLQKAGRIAAERKKLLNSLNTTTNTGVLGTDIPDVDNTATATGAEESLHALKDVTTSWLSLHEKSQALEANLMEEHVACMELVAKCFGGVLNPLQKAKAVVASYPDFPDVFAIATAAVVEIGACTGPKETSSAVHVAAAVNGKVLVQ